MSPLRLEIVTQERVVYSQDVDMVVAPGGEGMLGILPHHAPLLAALKEGELKIKRGAQEEYFAVSGGLIEVRPDQVIVLAEAAEHAGEIDMARAEEARKRAEQMLKEKPPGVDLARIEGALRRSQIRLKVARRKGRIGPPELS